MVSRCPSIPLLTSRAYTLPLFSSLLGLTTCWSRAVPRCIPFKPAAARTKHVSWSFFCLFAAGRAGEGPRAVLPGAATAGGRAAAPDVHGRLRALTTQLPSRRAACDGRGAGDGPRAWAASVAWQVSWAVLWGEHPERERPHTMYSMYGTWNGGVRLLDGTLIAGRRAWALQRVFRSPEQHDITCFLNARGAL